MLNKQVLLKIGKDEKHNHMKYALFKYHYSSQISKLDLLQSRWIYALKNGSVRFSFILSEKLNVVL